MKKEYLADLEAQLKVYTEKKLFLFPIRKDIKRPAIKDNLNKASNDLPTLMQWAHAFPYCNWAISCAKSGLVVVDVDPRNDGMKWLDRIEFEHGLPDTLTQATPQNGYHFVYNAVPGERYKGKIKEYGGEKVTGVDIKFNGYILVSPSTNSEGKFYKWSNKKEVANYPTWLGEVIEKHINTEDSMPINVAGTYLYKLVDAIRDYDLDYDDWLKLCMGIHHADPTEDGFKIALRLTMGKNYQDGDEVNLRAKWDGFTSDSGITSKTVLYIARDKIKQHGGVMPRPETLEERAAWFQGRQWYEEQGAMITEDRDFLVEDFNSKGFGFVRSNANAPIAHTTEDDNGLASVTAFTREQARLHYADHSLKTSKVLASGVIKSILTPAIDVFCGNVHKKEYDRIGFYPKGCPENVLNLWRGFPVEAVDGPCDDLLDMIRESLCNYDEDHYRFLLNWLAFKFQYPEKKTPLVPVLIGAEGTGKGFLFDVVLRRLLKSLHVMIASNEALKNKFNKAIAFKLFIILDEALVGWDAAELSLLKNLTGSNHLRIEEKHGAIFEVNNVASVAILSNSPDAVRAGLGNRRFNFIETGTKYLGNTKFFTELERRVKEEYLAEKFMRYLLEWDLTAFDPYKLPLNHAGEFSKIKSGGPVIQFLHDLLFYSPKPVFLEGDTILTDEFYTLFQYFAKETGVRKTNLTKNYFFKQIEKAIPAAKRTRKKVGGKKPHVLKIGVEEALESFCGAMAIDKPKDFDPFEYIAYEGDTDYSVF